MMLFAPALTATMLAVAPLPTWDAPVPDPGAHPSAGLPTPSDVSHAVVYFADNATWGGYNHGPTMTNSNGTYFMSWYNGAMDESVANRVLFATSADGEKWSAPAVLFETTAGTHTPPSAADGGGGVSYPSGYNIGLENEAWVLAGAGGERLYGLASSWDVFQRRGRGAEHAGPDAALMRRVHHAGAGAGAPGAELGPVFWLADEVPAGFERYCNVTYRDAALDGAARADAAEFRARLIGTSPAVDAGQPNERSFYALPALAGDTAPASELVLLLRTGNESAPVMWASRCSTPAAEPPPAAAPQSGACRPGTGIFMHALLPEQAGAAPTCDWSTPRPTSIPDSHTRGCAATLPDGRIFLVGSQLPLVGRRTVLTLSLSSDGLSWDTVWSLRGEDTLPPIRYHGFPGFQYPSAFWKGGTLHVCYSVNKEDIAVTRLQLSAISAHS